jgi:hypothetical protein
VNNGDGSSFDFDDLLMQLVDGELDSQQQHELAILLRTDPIARARYVDYLLLDSLLSWEQGIEEWGVGSEERTEQTSPRSALHSPLPTPHSSLTKRRLAALAVAVLVIVAGLAGRSWWRSSPTVPVAARPPLSAEGSATFRTLSNVASATDLASVVKLDAVAWESGPGLRPAEGDIVQAGLLNLRAGRISLSFVSGVVLTLEGPACLELVAVDRVFCHRGRLRARVPAEARGFVVSAPGSALTDLGTEFAINVDVDGKARGMVFQGAAEVAVLGAGGKAARTLFVEQSEAFTLDPQTGQIHEAPPDPEDFVIPLRLVAPRLILDASYPRTILDSHPSGYWRFEALRDGIIPNELAGQPPLRVHGPLELEELAPGNHGAVFHDVEEPQYLELDGLWEPLLAPGHAVEVWLLTESMKRATLISLDPIVADPTLDYSHLFLLELTGKSPGSQAKPEVVRFMHRWPPGNKMSVNIYSRDICTPNTWYHLVAQKRSGQMELYLNGTPVHSLALDPADGTLPCRLLVGRLTTKALDRASFRSILEHGSWIRSFVGRIDELAIYDHPLSAEEIQHHYRLAAATGAAH